MIQNSALPKNLGKLVYYALGDPYSKGEGIAKENIENSKISILNYQIKTI